MQNQLLHYLYQGAYLSFMVPSALGPLGILCVYRILINGRLSGVATALGSIAADLIYAGIVVFGAAGLTALAIAAKTVLGVAGGAFLCWVGVEAFKVDPMDKETLKKSDVPMVDFLTTVGLGLCNTLKLTTYKTSAHTLGFPALSDNTSSGLVCLLGMTLGAAALWVVIILITGLFHDRLKPAKLFDVSRWSGVVIGVFGLFIIAVSLIVR